jgi:hypothetical protein
LACGPFIPKAQIGAIRSGYSTNLNLTPQVCSLYLGAFTPPGHDPLALRDEIARTLADADLLASEIDLYLFRQGYEAKGADRLIEAVTNAHRNQFGAEPPRPDPATNSMWRDINIFNEVGIPAITYCPRSERHSFRRSLKIESLHQAARVYARTICDICLQEKPRSGSGQEVLSRASERSVRLTKWALRHASMPTMHAGSLRNVSASARRLIFRRKAICPSAPKATMWKTYLPISMPTDVKTERGLSVLDDMNCFSCDQQGSVVKDDSPRGSCRSIPVA